MKHYAIQTNLNANEIHAKLGFESFMELQMRDFDDTKEQVYIMSLERIELDYGLSKFSDEELIQELCINRGISACKIDELMEEL